MAAILITGYAGTTATQEFRTDQACIDNNPSSAVVQAGRWILYAKSYFNEFHRPSNCALYKIVDSTMGKVNFNYQSARPITGSPEALTLYAHYNFGGQKAEFNATAMNIAQGFSSSIVNRGGEWKMFTKPDLQGLNTTLGGGDYPASVGVPDDSVQSAQKLVSQ